MERIKAFLAASSQSAKAEPASPAPEILPPENAAEPLTVKLQKLEAAFSPSSENAARPREFLDLVPFQDAVALLGSDAVPLKTVLQYAIGTNWALSCTGLAALAQRPDGAEAQAQVLSAFDRLAPWAMHYALSYFRRCPSSRAGRSVRKRKGVVAGQPGSNDGRARIFRRGGALGRYSLVWRSARYGSGGILCGHPELSRTFAPRRCSQAHPRDRCEAARRDRPDIPLFLRALLGDSRKARFARRARRLERTAPASRNGSHRPPIPAAACNWRDADRKNFFPAPARQAPGVRRLDGVRSRRRRS